MEMPLLEFYFDHMIPEIILNVFIITHTKDYVNID